MGKFSRAQEQTCLWCCKELVAQEGRGRKRKYCSLSCKQRAYEQRTNLRDTSIPPDAVILRPERVDVLRDQLFELRCAAEDISTAYAEDSDRDEITKLCGELVSMARQIERLRL